MTRTTQDAGSTGLVSLASRIDDHHAECVGDAQTALEHARQASKRLIEAKSQCLKKIRRTIVLVTAEEEAQCSKSNDTKGKHEKRNGWAGIRTQGTLTRTAVFKTAAQNPQELSEQELAESPIEDSAFYLALLHQESPDLAAVIEAWPKLPEAIRAAILAMIEATRGE